MNILVINQYADSPELGDRRHSYLLAKQWAAIGDQVVIVAADYNPGRRQNPTVSRDLEQQRLGDVDFAFLQTPHYSAESEDKSISYFTKRLQKLAPEIAERYKPEVVVAASAHPYDIFGAQKIAKKARSGLVFELRENWPDIEAERQGRDGFLANRAMSVALRRSSKVISLLSGGAKYLEQFKVPAEKALYIPQVPWLLHRGEKLSQERREDLKRIRAGYDFLVMYQGALVPERGLLQLVEAAKMLEEQGVAAVLAGDGELKGRLCQRMRELGAANVFLLPGVAEEERAELYTFADCFFYGDERASAVRYGVRSEKLMEYMAFGAPVVTALKTAESPVVLAGCGLNAKAESAGTLADVLAHMQAMTPAQRHAMGERGRTHLTKNYDIQNLARKYREVLQTASGE